MRLIDADALKANVPNTNVDIFENCRNCSTLMDWQVKELIDKQPVIDAVKVVRGEWVPCSERFPELDKEVLVYAIGKDDGFIGDSVIAISERFIFRLFPSSDGVEEWRSPWEYFDSNYEITHWMPLPEPPKGEEE